MQSNIYKEFLHKSYRTTVPHQTHGNNIAFQYGEYFSLNSAHICQEW
jgi:hypothetical protein